MKTTVELPDALFRQAKSAAATQGISLKKFLTRAVKERLRDQAGRTIEKPWMAAFGGLCDLHRETKRVERVIRKEFETIDKEEWR